MNNTEQQQERCTLCGLPVEIDGFFLTAPNSIQKFCCSGCLSIYQLLNDDNIEPPLITQPLNHEDNKK
ncbi:MAG: heavy metal translocating P-type ATPase metal-binding domain-containing protein [Methylococcales bacterium]|nr:heavy metal translocating P-type ATPase metal-binding domain-containing protein [Methylococcales bacterium]MDP3837332.1 heavy metal translocating P-type ATPase metal-binding domain-containing protein [Methylococcales bacterium]